jgi:tetratricopeptide (TPR) repeat protein
MEMLDLYERRREMALTAFGDRLHVDSVFDELTRDGRKWVDAKGRQEAPRRALVMATFALEVVDRALPSDTTRRLIDWVRQQVLNTQKPSPIELLWHFALVAQLEVIQDTREMSRELEYVRDRFPTEPRFDLARGWLEYASYNPGSMLWTSKMGLDHQWDTWEIPFLEHAESLYSKALANPATGGEARVRIAELRLKANRPDEALAMLQEADRTSRDKETRYLSALQQGWAYTLKQDRPHAIEAFRKALAFLPDAPVASVALGAQLLLDGQRDEAGRVTDAALKSDVRDPWLYHRIPEYRLWPEWIGQLREQLK